MSSQIVLTDSETLIETIDCLSEHIKIKTQGDCDRDCLLKILVKTASRSDTIENTINSLNDVPASNTVRYHLNKLDNFEELEKNLNSALKSKLMPSINKTSKHLMA